jgi:hypothetical protein
MFRTWRTPARSVAVAVCAAFSCIAAPALTVVQDVLYKADGTRFDGFAQISWKSFQAADGSEIPQQSLTVRVTNGSLRATLVPTTNALRPATYTVKFNSDGRTQFTEYWAVPPSSAPLRLKDVRAQAPAPGNIEDSSGPVAIGSVTGLRTELDLRPAKGSSYVASRAAVINASGAIDAALGQLGDCLRVDGTTAPCGAGGLLFVDGETPSGVVNGVNTEFSLSAAPTPAGSLTLFRNGMLLKQGVDYTVSSRNIVLAPGNALAIGERLQAWYRLPPTGTPAVDFVDAESPAGVINGVNAVFTLAGTPLPASSLRVFRNGLLQKEGVDFTVAVNTITFTPVAIPQLGDIVQVSYRK